jgi:hypothetical protein
MTGFLIGLSIGLVSGPFAYEGAKWCFSKFKQLLGKQ